MMIETKNGIGFQYNFGNDHKFIHLNILQVSRKMESPRNEIFKITKTEGNGQKQQHQLITHKEQIANSISKITIQKFPNPDYVENEILKAKAFVQPKPEFIPQHCFNTLSFINIEPNKDLYGNFAITADEVNMIWIKTKSNIEKVQLLGYYEQANDMYFSFTDIPPFVDDINDYLNKLGPKPFYKCQLNQKVFRIEFKDIIFKKS